jgi:hypothetical protein
MRRSRIALWRKRVLYTIGVLMAGAAVAAVFWHFGGRGPRCSELTTPTQVRAEANEIYDAEFAPGDEIKGGPEDNPRTLARYRRTETAFLRQAIRAACGRHSPEFRPRRSAVHEASPD